MDKNEFNLKIEELKVAMHNRDFEKAVDIADTLELKKIKDNNFLSLVADAYELTHKYKEAKKVLLLAYENTNAGRHLAYRLCLIAIKNKEYDEAREFYEDFVEMAPRDTTRYILKYKMAKAQGKPIDKLIEILEEYVNIDMEEKWAYELAKLYHMAGDEEKCVDICDEIGLWFSEGKYVIKAMELKRMYRPLTSTQQQKYEENKKKSVEEAAKLEAEKIEKKSKPLISEENGVEDISEIKIKPIDEEKFNTMDIQEVIAHGMKEVEIKEEANIHEGEGATKVAPDFTGKGDMEEVEITVPDEPEKLEELGKIEGLEELEEELEELQNETEQEEITIEKKEEEKKNTDEKEPEDKSIETEPIKDIKGVEDILRQLQERGILKEETVRQAVNIIDEAGKEDDTKSDNISTSERWAEDNKPVQTTKNNSGIKFNVVEPPKDQEENVTKDTAPETPVEQEETVIPEESDKEKSMTIEDLTAEQEEVVEIKKEQIPEENVVVDEEKTKTEEPSISNKNTGKIPDVPVFDLSFESPQRDSSNDIGQENMYENIVANSDLGNSTDKLPSKEEIEEAIKTAERAMEDEVEQPNSEEQESEQPSQTTDLYSQKNLSAKVEIISGADWEQPEADKSEDAGEKKEELEEDKSEEIGEENQDSNQITEQVENITEHKESDDTVISAEDNHTDYDKVDEKRDEAEEEPQVETKLTLTEEELAAFKNYLNVEGFESNIREVLQKLIADYNPNGKSETGNVIIMGAEKTGKTTLAIEMIKLVNSKRGRRNRKLAKIEARALNRRGFRNSLNKLLGCDLIIENAQELGVMTLSEVVDASGMFTDDMLIVLEGETGGMEKILEESPRISTVFDHVIRIKEYDIKEWVEYGIRYANSQGYAVDELANLAFYKTIDDFFGTNKGIGQSDVEDIVDQAISKSKRIGRKLSGIFSSKKDEEGLNILVESDFKI
ncbi:MAG: hypothetical protein ACLRZ9_01755 [Eubacterium sp.]